MELKQLRAVLAIADTGSMTKAAELLHVVQPALSRQLRLLETELGKPLFLRERLGMEPTEEGWILIRYAREALLSLEKATTEIKPARGIVAGLVSVGMLPSVCDLLASDLLRNVQQIYPQIRLRFTTGSAWQLQKLIEDGSVDLALLFNPKPHAAVQSRPLVKEPLFLAGLPGFGANWRESEPISVLQGLPLILPSAEHSVRGILEHACAVEKVTMHVTAEADSAQLTKTLLLSGAGCTVLPGITLTDAALKDHVRAVLLGRPPLYRKVTLSVSVRALSSVSVRSVSAILEERVGSIVKEGRWPDACMLRT